MLPDRYFDSVGMTQFCVCLTRTIVHNYGFGKCTENILWKVLSRRSRAA